MSTLYHYSVWDKHHVFPTVACGNTDPRRASYPEIEKVTCPECLAAVGE